MRNRKQRKRRAKKEVAQNDIRNRRHRTIQSRLPFLLRLCLQLAMEKEVVVVCCAGYFDPIHPGHRSHFQAARALGDKLVVITHPDEFCIKKKGFCYMKLAKRIQTLMAEPDVDEVVVSIDGDGTVAKTLKMVRPQVFAKGGDRTPDNMPQNELDACAEIGCAIVYNVGAPKRWSSTEIGKKALGLQ